MKKRLRTPIKWLILFFSLLTSTLYAADTVNSITGPATITKGEAVTLTIDYEASQERTLVVYFQALNPKKLHFYKRITVDAGDTSEEVTFTVPKDILTSGTFRYKAYIAPKGGKYSSNLGYASQKGVVTINNNGSELINGGGNESGLLDAFKWTKMIGQGKSWDLSVANCLSDKKCIHVNPYAENGGMYQVISTEEGKTYTLEAKILGSNHYTDVNNYTLASSYMTVESSTPTPTSTPEYQTEKVKSSTPQIVKMIFIATSQTTYISLRGDTAYKYPTALSISVKRVGTGGGNDTTPPEITLNGISTVSLKIGDDYEELGATAFDNEDGDVGVNITGNVNTDTEGTYTIIYSAIDTAKNSSTKKRIVNIESVTLGEGSVNSLATTPTYTHILPSTTELVKGGANELSNINPLAWETTDGSRDFKIGFAKSETYVLALYGGTSQNQMYQEIDVELGKTYVFKGTTTTAYGDSERQFFTVETSIPTNLKANVLGESIETAENFATHNFEFTATTNKVYLVLRTSRNYKYAELLTASIKEKGRVVPYKQLTDIRHHGLTIPFDKIKSYRGRTDIDAYADFINSSDFPKALEAFTTKKPSFPSDGILNLDNETHVGIVSLWPGESKTVLYWAIRAIAENNTTYMQNAVDALDEWASHFEGMSSSKGNAATYISWFLKDYSEAYEIILHNDIGYVYPPELRSRSEDFLDAMYSQMLTPFPNNEEMLEDHGKGGNWVASQLMAKLSYWIVKHSFATTPEEKRLAVNKVNWVNTFFDSLFVSQIFMLSDPLGMPNTFWARELKTNYYAPDRVQGGSMIPPVGETKPTLDALWYMGENSDYFIHDGIPEEYYRDFGHAHMGNEPILSIAYAMYLQGGENLFERHKDRLIAGAEVLAETALADMNIGNNSYLSLPVGIYMPTDSTNVIGDGSKVHAPLYGYAKDNWDDYETILPKVHQLLNLEGNNNKFDNGWAGAYAQPFIWTD